ncbi:hypothetical protein CBL_21467, partial [Carabus blaptoides fortunei]
TILVTPLPAMSDEWLLAKFSLPFAKSLASLHMCNVAPLFKYHPGGTPQVGNTEALKDRADMHIVEYNDLRVDTMAETLGEWITGASDDVLKRKKRARLRR